MDKKERQQEENLSALLKAGYPDTGGLNPHLRSAFYTRIIQTRRIRPAFPETVLGLLCAALILLELLAAGAAFGLFTFPANDLFLLITGGIIFLNLLCLPIANILIVIRRKYAK